MIACVGHVCWHAVRMSPSRTGRFSSFARSLPAMIRCTHMVHFSITPSWRTVTRSEEHTSELQSLRHLVCRLLLEKKKKKKEKTLIIIDKKLDSTEYT